MIDISSVKSCLSVQKDKRTKTLALIWSVTRFCWFYEAFCRDRASNWLGRAAKSFQHRFLLDQPPSTGEQRNLRVLAKIALSLEMVQTMYFECFKEIRKALSWAQMTTPLT